MSLNMKTFTQALVKTAAVIEKTVQTTVQEVTGPRPLQDYDLLDQVGSGGPGLYWRLYSARPRPSAPSTNYPLVCVWLLDKRSLSDSRARAGLSKAAEDGFLDLVRADAARLVRIRHPGVVHVVQALDESKYAMAMVTEPLFASVANVLGNLENVAKVPKELKGMEMGLLEVKHGLLQVSESLDFLHNNARLIHRAVSPETVFITAAGAWKLGGFGFAIPVDQASGGLSSTHQFHYPEYDVEDSILPLQPSLNYTAPELVRSKSLTTGCSSDMFGFGCLAYHLIARKPLLDCHNNVKMYMNTLTYLTSEAFSVIPQELIGDLQRMLSQDEASRPSASAFTGSSFFRDDTRLRALRFLDHMLERDNMQKTEFLKALSDMWKDFDSRVLRYKVLPPLCAELRNMVMQPMILPMVFTIAESQDKIDFELSTLPALVPVLSSASGETLLLLVRHAELIINKASLEHLISHLLPVLVRAYDDTDPRLQEEVLRRTVPLARQIDIQLVKQTILPRIHTLALKTTVAAVRVNALCCLGDLVSSLDKHAILDILQTVQRCTAVDRSVPTLMCSLGVANAIYKQYGVEFAAEHVLPLLFPLLTAPQLSVQQFAKYMLFVKDIIRKIEEKRGVSVTDAGIPEVKVAPSLTSGPHTEPISKPSLPVYSSKSSPAWDEDWGPISKGSSTTSFDPNQQVKQPITVSQPATVTATPLSSSMATLKQQTSSYPPVEIEWPPTTSTAFTTQISVDEKQNKNSGALSSSSFDNLDPFANWPPKPSNSSSSTMGSFTKSVNSYGSSGPNMSSFGLVTKLPQGSFSSNTSIGNSNSLLGMVNSNSLSGMENSNSLSGMGNSNSLLGRGYSNGNNNVKRTGDLGSIFASTNTGQPTLRLAPPPTTVIGRGTTSMGRGASAMGRGRGRNQGQIGRSQASRSKQPPILDLL